MKTLRPFDQPHPGQEPSSAQRSTLLASAWAGACGLGLLVPFAAADAHGGGLNAEGCYHERKTGGYHCHRAPSPIAPPAKFSQAGVSAAPQVVGPAAVPTCYVGPKGGTYTIPASGRKNYNGC